MKNFFKNYLTCYFLSIFRFLIRAYMRSINIIIYNNRYIPRENL